MTNRENSKDPKDILCPCGRCGNFRKYNVKVIRGHLYEKGFSLGYTDWIWHGETSSKSVRSSAGSTFLPKEQNAQSETIDVCEAAYNSDDHDSYDFNRFGISNSAFTDLLTSVGSFLPQDHVLPVNAYEAKKTLSDLGLKCIKFHACPNNCILYRGINLNASECPKCRLSRWKVAKDGKLRVNSPAKVMWYFPIIPRFKRMFKSPDTAEQLIWDSKQLSNDGQMRHPDDSPSWRNIDYRWPSFASDPRNLRLALGADGINPFNNVLSNRYSCWPVVLVAYNLPPWLCMKRKFIMLSILIPGPHEPGNDIDVYLEPLIDDLKKLWVEGEPNVYDAYSKSYFTLKAVLMWTINDFPGYTNLSGCVNKGYKSYPICGDDTVAKYLSHSKNMCYQGHRRYLADHHPYSRQKLAFNGEQELRRPRPPLFVKEVLAQQEQIKFSYGKEVKKSKKVDCPWKKKSIFFELEYWKFNHVRHCLDVMHIEKNVYNNMMGTLLNMRNKSKDSEASHHDMLDMGVRVDLAPQVGEKKTYVPPSAFTLSKAEKRTMLSSFLNMKLPYGHAWNIKSFMSMADLKIYGLKSHDCHILLQQLLLVAIRSVLPKHVRVTIIRLCFFFNSLCSKVVDISKLDKLWMYAFERFNKVMKSYIRNHYHPEGCIAESYLGEESVEFCTEFLKESCKTAGVPKDQFRLSGPLSFMKMKEVEEKERDEAHLTVLLNNSEVFPYIIKHMEYLEEIHRGKKKSVHWLMGEHNRLFADWFERKVRSELKENCAAVSEMIRWLAAKPSYSVLTYEGYLVDGVMYFIKDRDKSRVVQNSGVYLVAKTVQVYSARDLNPIESDMTFYGIILEIWELDYHDFKAPLFLCKWASNDRGIKVDDLGFTLVDFSRQVQKKDKYVFVDQVKQVFYVEDPVDATWSIVLKSTTRDYHDINNEDNLGDTTMEHQPFCSNIPACDVADDMEHRVRENVEGIWVKN
ncbi:uncharacterized protein LOC141664531 [Apium graveolens]|uniref:uncharacterized protein LOC141664531 n=1 Tax=Apium graveolens TaxID=4045 RepID=UPI003D7B7F53